MLWLHDTLYFIKDVFSSGSARVASLSGHEAPVQVKSKDIGVEVEVDSSDFIESSLKASSYTSTSHETGVHTFNTSQYLLYTMTFRVSSNILIHLLFGL